MALWAGLGLRGAPDPRAIAPSRFFANPLRAHEPRPMMARPLEQPAQVGRTIPVALAAPRSLYQGCGLPGTLTRSV